MIYQEDIVAALEPLASGPAGATDDVTTLQSQLEGLDTELLGLVRRRTAVARRLQAARADTGQSRYVHDSELSVMRRFRNLGPAGRELAGLLLRLGR